MRALKPGPVKGDLKRWKSGGRWVINLAGELAPQMHWQPPRIHRNLRDPVTHFQVLGERNSGTNYINHLLTVNLAPVIEERRPYGWKHGFIDRRIASETGLLTVVVYRHPIRWLQSVNAHPLHLSRKVSALTFSEFIRHEWQGAFEKSWGEEPSQPDQEPDTGRLYPDPMSARKAKLSYLEALADMPGQIAFLRFEDANRHPRRTLEALSEGLGLELVPFSPVRAFKGQARNNYRPRTFPPISPDDMDFILARLDLKLEERVGYDAQDPPRFDGLPPWDPRSIGAVLRPRPVKPR